MKIAYEGHAWFTLTADMGFTMCCDPYDASVGYRVPNLHADAVTVSHAHHDHNNVQALQGVRLQCDETRRYDLPCGEITGFSAWHDDQEGGKRGANIMYRIVMHGVRVLHLGDLGHMLSEDMIRAIGPVDVLLVPVGGFYTIDAEMAARVTEAIQPAIAIPMHYRTAASKKMPIETYEPYLRRMHAEDTKPVPELIVSAGTLPKPTQVVLMDCRCL